MKNKRKWPIATLGLLILTVSLAGWFVSSKNKTSVGISEGPPLPEGMTQPQLIILLNQDAYFLAPDGALYRWGGKSTTSEIPQAIKPGLRFRRIAADQNAVIGIRKDGTIWGWGSKSRVIPFDRFLPSQEHRQLFSDTGFKEVSMGQSHAIAIKDNGTLWAWGSNGHGELGQGIPPGTELPSLKASDVPMKIGVDKDWIAIHTAHTVSYAIKQDGTIWRWGKMKLSPRPTSNAPINVDSNQFQEDMSQDFSRPERFTTVQGWKQVVALPETALLLHEDGSLWIDGTPPTTQAWLNLNSQVSKPNGLTQIGREADWTDIVASENFILAQKRDRSWWGIGQNTFNPMGLDTHNESKNFPFLTVSQWKKLPDAFEPWAIGLGGQTTLVLTHDGRLWSSGWIIGSKRKDPLWNHFAGWVNSTANKYVIPLRLPKHHSGFHYIWTWEPK